LAKYEYSAILVAEFEYEYDSHLKTEIWSLKTTASNSTVSNDKLFGDCSDISTSVNNSELWKTTECKLLWCIQQLSVTSASVLYCRSFALFEFE